MVDGTASRTPFPRPARAVRASRFGAGAGAVSAPMLTAVLTTAFLKGKGETPALPDRDRLMRLAGVLSGLVVAITLVALRGSMDTTPRAEGPSAVIPVAAATAAAPEPWISAPAPAATAIAPGPVATPLPARPALPPRPAWAPHGAAQPKTAAKGSTMASSPEPPKEAQSRPAADRPPPGSTVALRNPEVSPALTLREGGYLVQLAGIEPAAPDRFCQRIDGRTEACATRARSALELFVRHRTVQCDTSAAGNGSSRCRLGGTDLSLWLLAQGLAARAEGAGDDLAAAEATARRKRLGLWARDAWSTLNRE